jgi:outer membrane protein
MKKITLLAFLVLASLSMSAQRFIYVDTDYILDKIPEYKKAQEELDAIAQQWKEEISKKYAEIDRLYKEFQAEQYLMDSETRKKKEDEIVQKEKEAKDFQKKKFGYQGELFEKRQELVKPIQDRVYEAIKSLAEERNYDFVLDKASSGASILYANPKYDKSDEILKKLGY